MSQEGNQRGSCRGALSPPWLLCLGLQDVESILCGQVEEATALSCPREGVREASPHVLPLTLTPFHPLPTSQVLQLLLHSWGPKAKKENQASLALQASLAPLGLPVQGGSLGQRALLDPQDCQAAPSSSSSQHSQ